MKNTKAVEKIKRPFWWSKRERTYTVEEIATLLAAVKEFNAGCIDVLLDKHVDKVYKEWLASNG